MIFNSRERELLEDLTDEVKELRKTLNVLRSDLTRYKVDTKNQLTNIQLKLSKQEHPQKPQKEENQR